MIAQKVSECNRISKHMMTNFQEQEVQQCPYSKVQCFDTIHTNRGWIRLGFFNHEPQSKYGQNLLTMAEATSCQLKAKKAGDRNT